MENANELLSTWPVCLEKIVRPNLFPLEHVVGEPSFLFHDHPTLQYSKLEKQILLAWLM